MTTVRITVGALEFTARFEHKAAPMTCAAFQARLPLETDFIQARWSGESAWAPLGDLNLGVPLENTTSHPSRGDILFYQAAASESEILFPYGSTCFGSKVGQLAGNHFMTLLNGHEHLAEFGRKVLWEGAQKVRFELVTEETAG